MSDLLELEAEELELVLYPRLVVGLALQTGGGGGRVRLFLLQHQRISILKPAFRIRIALNTPPGTKSAF